MIGASFWIVQRINTWDQFNPSIICGNQKWKGALASFKRSAIKMKEDLMNIKDKNKILDAINNEDLRAWIKKYFRAASE